MQAGIHTAGNTHGSARVRPIDFESAAALSGVAPQPLSNAPSPPPFWRKHWSGAYSIGRSFWLHYVLVGLLVGMCEFIALYNLKDSAPRLQSLATLGIVALDTIFMIWSIWGAAARRR